MKTHLLIPLLVLCAALDAAGQETRKIRGTVYSAPDGQPLPGVSIVVKGSTRGTSSDAEGNYSLPVNGNDVLVFSFIGYSTQEVTVGSQTQLDVRLEEDVTPLEEVVIVSTGYEELPRERATGSFTHVGTELLNRSVSTNVLTRLEDVTSGMTVNRNGESRNYDISIRGMSTINSNTQPLIVIDNFPYEGELSTINPNDVESITVLKDAAAASIWGARAGNGVIVITTKKGRDNQPLKVAFNANVSVLEKPDMFYHPRMSSAEVIDIERMLFDRGYYQAAESSLTHEPLTPAVELMIAGRDGLLSAGEVDRQLQVLGMQDVRRDYEKYLYREGVNQQYALNLSGGSASNRYYLSAGWDRNAESLVANSYNRLTLNASNSWSAIRDRLKVSAQIYYTESFTENNNEGPSSIFFNSVYPLYPYARLRDDQGNNLPVTGEYRLSFLDQAEADGLLNWQYVPLDEINNRDNTTKLTDYRINTRMNYKISESFSAELLYQYWRSISETRDLQDLSTYYTRDLINRFSEVDTDGSIIRPVPLGGILQMRGASSVGHSARGQLNYGRTWREHELHALAGYEIRDMVRNTSAFRYYGYDDELATNQVVDYVNRYPRYDRTGSTSRISNLDGISSYTDRFISYYANAAYTLAKRYIVSASGRKDQSNLFGVRTNQRGVPLWSAGLGWNVHNEGFYSSAWLPYLKLRTTFGYNGNINKNVTAYTTARAIGNDPFSGLPYAMVTNPPNSELRWERVKVLNAGADFELAKAVLSGSIEFYVKQGIDLIGTTPYPPSTGISLFTGNNASTRGRGMDVVLTSKNVDRELKWTTNLIFNYLKEKVTGYEVKTSATSLLNYGSGGLGVMAPQEGKPLYGIYSYSWAGLDPATGDPRSYLGGEPSSDYKAIVAQASPESLIYHGPARPTVFGALRNNLSWKGLALSFNISYRFGYYFRRTSVGYSSILSGQTGHGDYALRWQKPGDEAFTDVPSMPATIIANRDEVYRYSETLVEKGDHIRLRDVSISYTLDRSVSEKLSLQRVQVYGYFDNLGIVWKATDVDLDPDFLSSRPVRSVALGLRVEF